MSFIKRGSVSGYPAGSQTLPTQASIIKNSTAIGPGDLVKDTGDGIEGATAGAAILGMVIGIYNADGLPIDIARVSDSSYTGSLASTGVYTASASNHDSGGYGAYALIDTDKGMIISGATDATIGTTTGSDLPGGWTDIADKDEVDENNAAAAFTAAAQLYKLGLDPKDSSRGLYMIHEWAI